MKKQETIMIDIDRRNIPSGMTRRSFIKRLGGGVVIAVAISDFVMDVRRAKHRAFPTQLGLIQPFLNASLACSQLPSYFGVHSKTSVCWVDGCCPFHQTRKNAGSFRAFSFLSKQRLAIHAGSRSSLLVQRRYTDVLPFIARAHLFNDSTRPKSRRCR